MSETTMDPTGGPPTQPGDPDPRAERARLLRTACEPYRPGAQTARAQDRLAFCARLWTALGYTEATVRVSFHGIDGRVPNYQVVAGPAWGSGDTLDEALDGLERYLAMVATQTAERIRAVFTTPEPRGE
jgi:hypothetical protein